MPENAQAGDIVRRPNASLRDAALFGRMGALKHTARTTADGKRTQGKYARKGRTLSWDNDPVYDAAVKSARLENDVAKDVKNTREAETYGRGRQRQAQAAVEPVAQNAEGSAVLSLAQLKDAYHGSLRLADAAEQRGDARAAEAHMVEARTWRRRINSCKRKGGV